MCFFVVPIIKIFHWSNSVDMWHTDIKKPNKKHGDWAGTREAIKISWIVNWFCDTLYGNWRKQLKEVLFFPVLWTWRQQFGSCSLSGAAVHTQNQGPCQEPLPQFPGCTETGRVWMMSSCKLMTREDHTLQSRADPGHLPDGLCINAPWFKEEEEEGGKKHLHWSVARHQAATRGKYLILHALSRLLKSWLLMSV